jgi:Flp pilus assembly protein TadD
MAETHYNLGVSYGELGRWQEAADSLNKAVELKPNEAKVYFRLGVTYLKLNDRRAAGEAHRSLEALDPNLAKQFLDMINQ